MLARSSRIQKKTLAELLLVDVSREKKLLFQHEMYWSVQQVCSNERQ